MIRKSLLTLQILTCLGLGALVPSSLGAAELDWHESLSAALEDAARSNRYVLVDLYADWCSWCKRLEAEVFPTETFSDRAQTLVLLKVDTEDGGEGQKLKQSYGISTLPTTLILDAQEAMVGSIVGFAQAPELVAEIDVKVAEWEALLSRAQALEPSSPAADIRAIALELHQRKAGAAAAPLYQRLRHSEDDPHQVTWLIYRQADAERIARQFDTARRLAAEAQERLARERQTQERQARERPGQEARAELRDDAPTDDLGERLALLETRIDHDQGQCDQAIAGLKAFLEHHPESTLRPYATTTLDALRSGSSRCG